MANAAAPGRQCLAFSNASSPVDAALELGDESRVCAGQRVRMSFRHPQGKRGRSWSTVSRLLHRLIACGCRFGARRRKRVSAGQRVRMSFRHPQANSSAWSSTTSTTTTPTGRTGPSTNAPTSSRTSSRQPGADTAASRQNPPMQRTDQRIQKHRMTSHDPISGTALHPHCCVHGTDGHGA